MPRKHGRYSHPGIAIQHPLVTKRTFRPGDIVEHVSLPGVGLKIITGPYEGVSGDKYYVIDPTPKGGGLPVGNFRQVSTLSGKLPFGAAL